MQTTSITRPLGFFRGMRALFLTMGLALLVLTPAQPAGAEPQAPPGTAGTGQAEACEMMGGHATVEVTRTVDGVSRTMVACSVEGLGGWWCVNTPASTTCGALPQDSKRAPSRWLEALNGQVLPVLESNSWVQIESAVTAFQANFSVLTSARSADARLQADDAHHGKSGKHGKQGKHHKHGKGRKG